MKLCYLRYTKLLTVASSCNDYTYSRIFFILKKKNNHVLSLIFFRFKKSKCNYEKTLNDMKVNELLNLSYKFSGILILK